MSDFDALHALFQVHQSEVAGDVDAKDRAIGAWIRLHGREAWSDVLRRFQEARKRTPSRDVERLLLGASDLCGPYFVEALRRDFQPGMNPSSRLRALGMCAGTWDLTCEVAERVLAPEAKVEVGEDGARVELAPPRPAADGEPWWRPFVEALERCEAGHPEAEEARLLAGEISLVGEALLERDEAAYRRVEAEYGGPGPMGDDEDLEEWVEENPEQAGDLLADLRAALAGVA